MDLEKQLKEIEAMGDEHVGSSTDTPLRPDAFELSDIEKIDRIKGQVKEIMETLHPFVQAVQFHPEDLRDSLSNSWGALFLQAVASQQNELHAHE